MCQQQHAFMQDHKIELRQLQHTSFFSYYYVTRTIRRYPTDWKACQNPVHACAMLKHTSADELKNECKQQKPKDMPKPGQASYKSGSSNNSSMKLIVVAEVKKFSAFYEIRMFMTVLIRTSQWNLSSGGLVHTGPARSALILSSYVCLVPPSSIQVSRRQL